MRPRRSMLFMPGSNARALEKAPTLTPDGFTLDLEDAVAPAQKDAARAAILAVLAAGRWGARERLVRLNPLATPWGQDDLAALACAGADGLVLPKVESADEIHAVERLLDQAGAPSNLALLAMIETPRGVLRAAEIASASPRLVGLIMGTSDLAKELRLHSSPDRLGLLPSLSACVLAARAHGLDVLDGVHLDLDDMAGFERACRQGAGLGFDGKTLIHPKTIEIANRAFAPQPAELERARRIIAAHEQAIRQGSGVVVVDGRLIENLHVAEAERLLALDDSINALELPQN